MRILRTSKWLFTAVAVLITALAAGSLTACSGTPAASPSPSPSASPGLPVPAAAVATVKQLVSGNEAQQRAALWPNLAAVLPAGAVFPAGSALALDSDSWHQSGSYANATGMLSEPGKSPRLVEIGFIRSGGSWLVTFEEAPS